MHALLISHTVEKLAVNHSRIAYFINQYPTVSQTFIRREILALERQGFEILRIALKGWSTEIVDQVSQEEMMRTRYVLRAGASVLVWAAIRTFLTSPRRFLSALALAMRMARGSERSWPYHLVYMAEACRVMPWIKSFGATHLHGHFGTNSAEIVMLIHALGGPRYSFTVHGRNEVLFSDMAEKIRRACFVVAISSYGRSQLYRKVEHSLWPKIQVVHCGIESAFYDIEPVPPPQARRLVCVGRLCEAKGQLLLVEAVQQLAQEGMRVELVLAGDGEMRTDLETLIDSYGLRGQVRITGWLSSDQVRQEILAARGLVLPSFSEGLPVVIMEAMALRRPVLSTYVGGIPELVRPGETGWLFPAGSIDDLKVAIEDFLLRPDQELRTIGDAAYMRVLERHSIDTESAKLAGLFMGQCP